MKYEFLQKMLLPCGIPPKRDEEADEEAEAAAKAKEEEEEEDN